MRINDAYRQAALSTDAAKGPLAQKAGATDGGAATQDTPAPVKVTVSEKAIALSTQTGEASDAKVARLQQSVAAGTFKVDPDAIANRIVDGD